MMRGLAILALWLWAGSGLAQTTALRSLDTENAAHVWRAVGRIDLGQQGFCSGTLIAPDLVLTAAHCLYRPGGAELFDTDDIVFRAGLRDGGAAVTRRVAEMAAHPGYRPGSGMTIDNVTHDVALLQLEQPVSTFELSPFRLHEGATGTGPVSVVSYGRGRADAQSRQRECQMLQNMSGVMVFDCDVTFGSSGAPVFLHEPGRTRIVALISGMMMSEGRKLSVGMALPERVDELRRQLRVGRRAPVAKVRRLGVGQGRNGSGAKFVRPAD